MSKGKTAKPGEPANSQVVRSPFLDTSHQQGMQGAQLGLWTPGFESALFFETVEQIYQRIFHELSPKAAIPKVSVEYRQFVNVNSSVRMEGGAIRVKLSDLLESAPAPIADSLARILIGKLLRKPAPASHVHRYRLYLNRNDVRRQIQLVRQTRGRKYISGPAGDVFDLGQIFEKLNQEYFGGMLSQPGLGWSRIRSRYALGHFDPSHNAIIISSIFDQKSTPLFALEYVMFHEMLHLQFPVDHSGLRRCVHTRAFREAEKRFAHLREAKAALKRLS